MKTIEEKNKAIAEFMGFKPYEDGSEKHESYILPEPYCLEHTASGRMYALPPLHMRFDTSWDWLMPVVEKIESTDNRFDIKGMDGETIVEINPTESSFDIRVEDSDKKKAVYKAVYELIINHNQS